MAEARLRKTPVRCNATELMLHSGRSPDVAPVPRADPSFRADEVEVGLRTIGGQLSLAMRRLEPHRRGPDNDLRSAYGAVHDAITDLAAVYNWLTLSRPQARPARRARRLRPWGG